MNPENPTRALWPYIYMSRFKGHFTILFTVDLPALVYANHSPSFERHYPDPALREDQALGISRPSLTYR